jgi:LysM repeat protein
MALPNLPRVAVTAGAIAVAAVALFFLPAILGIGGGGNPAASVRPSAGATASLQPTEPPAPTPILYTIKKNETLSRIATAHGITIEELLAANPQIKNPDKIVEGQQITIPTPSEAPPGEVGGSAEPSAAP